MLGLGQTQPHDKYLGLPTLVGRGKRETFRRIKERVWSKMQLWRGKCFSMGGRELLIKSVAQSVPTYTMSVFRLPAALCDDLQTMMARFWWGSDGESRKLHWWRWEKLCRRKEDGGLGFRDVSAFNQALVAKQSWRIIQNPDSLLARVLKDKYFKETSFLEAKARGGASYLWRSILWGRNVINLGLRRRIGDGLTTRVFVDPWVPRPSSFRVITKMPDGGDSLMVADLMMEGNRVWDNCKIENTFWPVDQGIIRSIPLGNGGGGDKWAWYFDPKGLYKVRSGYRAIMESKRLDSSSYVSSDVSWWRKMWSLPIPPKVRLFVWRAFHGIIPTMVSLKARGVGYDGVCPRCKDEIESTSHAIFDCPTSQTVWRMSRFWMLIENRRALPFADFLRSLKSGTSTEDFALICWLAWKLWHERNKVVHGGENGDPHTILDLSIASFGEWQTLNRVPPQVQAVGAEVWLPPQPGFLKLNVDASVQPAMDHIGIGVVLRDEKGVILGAVAKSVEGSFSPFMAECIALREGLIFAKELHSGPIAVETDAINVVSAVGENCELSMEGPILEDVKHLLAQVQSPGVLHIRRSANHVAHLLARFGFNAKCTNVWISETPIIVSNIVSFESIV